jgi:phage terminase large subunit GpA-like protein
MDAFTDPAVSDIVLITSAQVGKSEILINCLGYIASFDPGPILFLQPTLDMAEAFSKDRIAPVIRDTKILSEKFAETASRDSGSTLLHKQFEGGQLTMSGANSPASLASRPIRILLADEIDRFPISAGTEGDPLSLAEKRTNNFWNRKRVKVSTPTIKGASRIETAYGESDMRRFYVPCPHCEEMQTLVWANVKFEKGSPETAAYCCPHCGSIWTEGEKSDAVSKGEWRGAAPFTGIAGFHINELYSPWRTLAQIADDFLKAQNNPERLKVWVNTSLGETWELAATDRADPTALQARAEPYALGSVPAGVGMVTAAVDTQGDRLELYVWGYGEGEEAWVLARHVFWGDPTHQIVWDQLLEQLDRPLTAPNGAPVIARVVAIDSGGLHTQSVYNFCRTHRMRRTPYGLQEVIAIKGQSQSEKTILGKPTDQEVNWKGKKIAKGVKLWPIGVSAAKSLLYGRFRIVAPGPGYVHFSNELPEEFYDQLTAEKLMTKYVKGFPRVEWQLDKGKRNEALDCAVYAYAGALRIGINRMRVSDWVTYRERVQQTRSFTARPDEGATQPQESQPVSVPQPPAPVKRKVMAPMPGRNWTTSWK